MQKLSEYVASLVVSIQSSILIPCKTTPSSWPSEKSAVAKCRELTKS